MSTYCAPRMDDLDLQGLAHGSTWQNTIGAQFVPNLQLTSNRFREIPLQAMRTANRTRDPIAAPGSKWWTVNVSGSMLVREIPAADAGTQALIGWSELQTSGVPTCPLYLKLKWDATEVLVSVGTGVRVSVLVPTITVSLLAPAQNVVENRNERNQSIGIVTPAALTTLVDTVASISVTSAEAPTGTHDARVSLFYTKTNTDIEVVNIPGVGPTATPSNGDYKIPARARKVQFTSSADPGAAGVLFFDNMVDRNVLGNVNNWGRDTSPIVDVPQNATMISVAGTGAPGSTYGATWELEL